MNILHRIRGEHIAEARGSLPDCEKAKDRYMVAEMDVPGFGQVLFLCKRFRFKHGKSVNWFWTVENAILEQDLLRFTSDPAPAE